MSERPAQSFPWHQRWPIGLDQVILLTLAVLTVVFALSYVGLLYQRHQAQVEKQVAAEQLREEKKRQRELQALRERALTEAYIAQRAAWDLLRGDENTTIVNVMPGSPDVSWQGAPQIQPTGETRTYWQQWLERFHLGTRTPR